MTLVATVRLDLPVLETCLESVPGTTLSVEQRRRSRGGRLELVTVVSGEGLSEFEGGLAADSTVAEWTPIGRDGDRGTYRIRLTRAAAGVVEFDNWSEGRAVFTEERLTGNGWVLEGLFQDRSAFRAFIGGCERNGVSLELLRLADDSASLDRRRSGLTELQLETIRTAFEAGYFHVPRGTSLDELSEEFDVSRQALSERIRRGVGTLVESTLRARPEAGGGESDESESDVPDDGTGEPSPVGPLGVADS
jgi:hypothetical protein